MQMADDAESVALPHTGKFIDIVRLVDENCTAVSDEAGSWCRHVQNQLNSVKFFTPSVEG